MKKQKATNVTWHEHKIPREERERLLGQKGVVLWFTGLSG
ncbi:MAG: adenylyl-sulfate kinase, partial [Candidatus Thermoplasmatota archaeon]|nr:adenylyl-sulfate kinase [Candidatus Thermoplasmatota archaeon]